MKHLFLIHSHITHQVAWAIIRHDGIDASDVVFVLDRGFTPNETFVRVVDLDLPDEFFLIYKNPFKGWGNLSKIRKFIDHLSGDEFVCYFPHTYSDFANMATSHPLCRGYSLMEEGLWSYFPIVKMNEVVPPAILGWKQRFLSQFFYKGQFKDRYFCKKDYQSVYCTSDKCFPDFGRKVVVDIGLDAAGTRSLGLPGLARKVIVLDSVVETRVVSEDDFMSGFEQMLGKMFEQLVEGEVVYLKRHPYQYVKPEFSDRLIAHLRKKIDGHEVQELAGDVSLEEMALTGSVDFYLNVSSVSIYAARLGCKVYSYARSIGGNSPDFMRRIDALPPIFHESVEFI